MSDRRSPSPYRDDRRRPRSPARSDDDNEDHLPERSLPVPRRKPIDLPDDDDSAHEDDDDRRNPSRNYRRPSSPSPSRRVNDDDLDDVADDEDEITPASRSRPPAKREARVRDLSDDDDEDDRKHSRRRSSDRYRDHDDDDNNNDDEEDRVRRRDDQRHDSDRRRTSDARRDSHKHRSAKREDDLDGDDSPDDDHHDRKRRAQDDRWVKVANRSKKRALSDDEYDDGDDDGLERDEKPKVSKKKKKMGDSDVADIANDADEEPKPRKLSEFEKIKEHNKSLRLPRKREIDHDVVESECLAFLERMMKARDDDTKAYKKGLPALEKIKMLREVEMIMMKAQHRVYLLDNMLLPVFTAWLDRLPDGTLPNVQVRTTLLTILLELRMDEDWVNRLEQSQGLGKVVHFLRRNESHEPNKRIAEKIMNKWAREVYKTDSNFHDLLEEFDKPEIGHRAPKDGVAAERKAAWRTVQRMETTEQKLQKFKKEDDQDTRIMAPIPKPTPFLFTTVAESSSMADERSSREIRSTKKNRKVNRTMSNLRRLNKRSNAQGARPSVNGR